MTKNVTTWQVTLTVTEEGDSTRADVTVQTGSELVRGFGTARRNPADFSVARIGDEVAAGRALVDAGRHLIGIASHDIEEIEGQPVELRS
jgi:hypothetical protein